VVSSPSTTTFHEGTTMFTTLLESRAPRTRSVRGTIVSLLVHGTVIAGAVALTFTPASANIGPVPTPRDSAIFIPVSRPPEHAPSQGREQLSGAPRGPVPPRPPTIDENWSAPNIPGVDVYAGPPLPADNFGSGVPTSGLGSGQPTAGSMSGGVIGERETDRSPRILGAVVQPRYPETLRALGISGHVLVQFVVDTTGRIEPGSLTVQEASRPEFVESVRDALPRFRFAAGEVAGRKVRTRVQLPFDFTLR
jgi:protein TonB